MTAIVAVLHHASPIAIWNQWDSRWYVGIATHGYHWSLGLPFTYVRRSSLAFYPLFPAMLHGLAGFGISPVVGGFLISNAAFLAALLYLHSFLRHRWDREVAGRAVLVLALFPTSFFTVAPYAEALFLLCAVGAMYHAQRGDALIAGLWLAGASLTHSTAVILIVPILILLAAHEESRAGRLRGWMLALGPPIVGWTIYGAYLLSQHLSPSLILAAEHGWHRSLSFPWTGFSASVEWLAKYGALHPQWAAENISEALVTIIFLGLTALAWRHLEPAAKAYCAGFWAFILCATQWQNSYYAPFGSMDRFVLALFPLATWAAWRVRTKALNIWLIFSATGMCTVAGIYIAGGWVG